MHTIVGNLGIVLWGNRELQVYENNGVRNLRKRKGKKKGSKEVRK